MTTPTLTPEKQFEQLCNQATRLIATHIMGWTIQQTDDQLDGVPRDAYFKDGERLGDTLDYPFNPATSIQDAFWVMDTLTKNRNVRFEIDYDPKCECTITTKRLWQNVSGIGASLPTATVQMALYLIAHDHPVNSPEQERIFDFVNDWLKAEEAIVKYAEYSGDGLLIDLDAYAPK